MTSQPYPPPGTLLDNQYLVERTLRGGMAVVYVVRDTISRKRFALKGLRRDDVDPHVAQQRVLRLQREARAWINLPYHPHIVQAHAYLLRDGDPLLLLECVDGPTVAEVLQLHGPLAVPQAIRWICQACAALQCTHEAQLPDGTVGLLHRDLKPSNLLVGRDGLLKATDFGLVRMHDVRLQTESGSFPGTAHYSSPEQHRSVKHVDVRADIYSLGVVLYEMTAGVRPFEADNPVLLVQRIQHAAADSRRVPEALRGVVARCLEKSPSRRCSDCRQLEAALAAIEAQCNTDDALSRCPQCGFLGHTACCPVCGALLCVEPSAGDSSAQLPDGSSEGDHRAAPPAGGAAPVVSTIDLPDGAHCSCGATYASWQRYCHVCGLRLPVPGRSCTHCGSAASAGDEYCVQCGSRLG